MQDLLATGLAWLTEQQREHAAKLVTLRRGNHATSALPAMQASQLLSVQDGRGNTKVERTDASFFIAAADYVINGVAVTPAAGDYIDVVFGNVTKRFEVMPIGTEPAWRYSDPTGQTQYQVHTKSRGMV